MFFIINTTPMCIFYTREINLKPYFLIFNKENKGVSSEEVTFVGM